MWTLKKKKFSQVLLYSMVTVENNDELYISESYKKVGERGRVEK
jgi:hypothetical protein